MADSKNMRNSESNSSQGKVDKVLFYIKAGMQDINELTGIFANVNNSIGNMKTVEADNTVKHSKIKDDARKTNKTNGFYRKYYQGIPRRV